MTLPTKNPIPSGNILDQIFNGEKIDEVVNSNNETYLDRFGVSRLTFAGMVKYIQTFLSGLTGTTGASSVGSSDGGTVQSFIDNTYEKFVFSKIKGDGTNQTSILVNELTNLKPGQVYMCNAKGVVYISSAIIPTMRNAILNFTGTKFTLLPGFDPLDNEMIRFNSLQDVDVYGFYTDGNASQLTDTFVQPNGQAPFGRILNWRLGDNSKNVRFYDITMVNTLYCGSQWGKNISNVIIDGIYYDNIGEHVFYISGTGGGNNTNLTFRNIIGGSAGVNVRNNEFNQVSQQLSKHETAFIKSSQTIGVNDNWVIENGIFRQEVAPGYAQVVLTAQDLTRARMKGIRVGNNISSIIYPTKRADYVEIDDVQQIDGLTGTTTRMIYSHLVGTTVKYWTMKNVKLPLSVGPNHLQMWDRIEGCDFGSTDSSASTDGTTPDVYNPGKVVSVVGTIFRNVSTLRCVDFDFIFTDCQFLSTAPVAGAGVIDFIGADSWTDGKKVIFNRVNFANTAGYSFVTQNANAWVVAEGCFGPMRNPFTRASSTMKKLEWRNSEVPSTGDPLANATLTARSISNLIGSDGTKNFTKYAGDITVAANGTTATRDLSVAVAGTFNVGNVRLVPQNAAASAAQAFVSVSGKVVTVTVGATQTSSMLFSLQVDVW